jgi:hypothetical protein
MATGHPDDGQHPLLLIKVHTQPTTFFLLLIEGKSLHFGVKRLFFLYPLNT